MKPISFIAGNKSRLLLLAAVATGVLGMQAGRGTLAYFTTAVTSDNNHFKSGTLTFQIGDVNGAPALGPVTTSIQFSNMKPGDTVYAPIEIKDSGSLNSKYGIRYFTDVITGGDTDLSGGLSLAIRGNNNLAGTGTRTSGAGSHDCNAATFATFSGIWGEAVQTTSTQMVASSTPGVANAGLAQTPVDIASGSAIPVLSTKSDILCLQVIMNNPGSGVNTYNNTTSSTKITFVFDGLVSDAAVILP